MQYQNQVGDLELQNMKLQEELDLLRSFHRSSQNELDSLRKRQTQTLMRIEELKESKERSDKKREELKLEVGKLKDQAKLSSKEIRALKEEVRQVKAANDSLEETIEACTVSYCALHRNTIRIEKYRVLEQSYLETKSELWRWKLKSEIDTLDLERKKMEAGNLRERLKAVEDERMVLKAVIKDIKDDQQALRNEITEFALTIGNGNLWDFVADFSEVTPTPQDVLSITLNHINFSSSYYTQQIETLNSANKSFTSKLSTTTSNLTTCQSVLADLRREHSVLRTRHSALEKAHEPCDGVREELLATEKECMFRGQRIEGLEEDLQRMEIKSRDDAEKVKRANELVIRAKSAEQALDEEIQQYVFV